MEFGESAAKVTTWMPLSIAALGVIKAARSLLDFIYLAQYTSHSDETLGYMEEALKTFHKEK